MPRISMTSLAFRSIMKAEEVASSSADDDSDTIWGCRGACCLGGKDGLDFCQALAETRIRSQHETKAASTTTI